MRPHLIFGHNPGTFTGKGSNAWLLGGRVPTLVDTGSGREGFLADLRAVVAQSEAPVQVLVTHGHPDHAGGAASVAAEFPGVRFYKFPWPDHDARSQVAWNGLADGDVVDAGDGQLWVVHTPGHSPDHVCFFEPRCGILFGGDLVMNGGTVVIPASSGGRLSHYLHSLHRVLELQPRRILPGHGPVIDQPASLLRGYLAHRMSRERQILEELGRGPASVAELVAHVYPNLHSDLTAAAGESMLAHLGKLTEEGRAVSSGSHPSSTIWRLA